MSSPASFRDRLRTFLTGPRVGWYGVALAIALSLPAVGSHRVFDDFILALGARASRDAALAAHRFGVLDLFTFTNGEPAENSRLGDLGSMLPWWSDPHLHIAFFRPLSALTHILDEAAFPTWVWVHYAHSLVWLALLVLAVARLYRRLGESPAAAGLATLLYAVDDAHGPAVAWLSNRNSILSAVFGTTTLIAHARWRMRGERASAILAPVCLLTALLSGESALATCAYLFAYAVVLDRGTVKRRAASLLPYAGVVSVWTRLYRLSGHGAGRSGVYLDPIADPGRFLMELPTRTLALLGAAFGPIPADLALFEPGAERRLLVVAALSILAVTYLLARDLCHDGLVRFWALGMLLACVPCAACYPTDRVLSFLGMGAMALVARILEGLLLKSKAPTIAFGPTRLRSCLALALGFVHAVLAPILLPVRAAQMRLVASMLARASETLDGIEDLVDRTIVIVNPPIDPFVSYIQAERAFRRVPRPPHLYWLATAVAPLGITRLGARTLLVRREGGFIASPIERLYRSQMSTLQVGSITVLTQMSAVIAETTRDGRPLQVQFRFAHDLDSGQYLFLVWDRGRLLPFQLPLENETIELPAQNVARALLATFSR